MTYFYVKQFPALVASDLARQAPWCRMTLHAWIGHRVAELLWPLVPSSTTWDVTRRAQLRSEIDAAFFHLYGVDRGDVGYIMETFPIVKRKDIAAHGEYRTKRLILEVYDAMQLAIDTGTEYQTILDPPPGHGPRHPAKES